MLKREFKVNFKGLVLWTVILLSMFLLVFLVYPSITNSDSIKEIDKLMEMFPKEMLKAFNMDIASISSVFGWFQTEGQVFLVLFGGIYASILGSTILVKEESDKTIEFLYSKPISRYNIINSKVLCGVINITLLVLIVTLFNLLGMFISNDLVLDKFLYLSLSPLIIFYCLFFVSLAISTFFSKAKQTMGIGIGIAFISYLLQTISNMSSSVSFLKYFSLFELAPSRYIIENNGIDIISICVGLIIMVVSLLFTYYNYNKKEFFI